MKAALLATAAGTIAAQSVKTVHTPLNLPYGSNRKISTNITIPATNVTIEVVYDSGSENFFLFGPGAIDNWGSSALATQGPCNASVPASSYYDYPASSTATAPVNHSAVYVYGGADKIYSGAVTINDTFEFTNVAGQSETVDDVRVQSVDFLLQRINDPQCTGTPLYDLGIMGVSPYYNNASTRVTAGPSIRQDFLERGVIDAPVQSMWFDEAPEDVFGTYTGGGLFGGIDTSKYSGDLVKVQNMAQPGAVGYYTGVPTVSVNGVNFTQPAGQTSCQLDSGTHDDTIPVAYQEQEAFFNATGIVLTPLGYVAWPGECDAVPADTTVDLAFPGATDGESVTIKVPLRAYVRVAYGSESGYCTLAMSTSGCFLGSPFHAAAFFAADDERAEVALAQGGVSTPGAAVDESSVVARIP